MSDVTERKFFTDANGIIFRIDVDYDLDPLNPRKDWDNIAHMMCWYSGYSLGDVNDYSDADAFLNDLLEKEYTYKQICNYIKKNKTINELSLKYDRKEREWQLWGYYRYAFMPKYEYGIINSSADIDWIYDDVMNAISIQDKIKMLTKKGYIFFPLSVYEHSGITMYIGSPEDHFDGQWDCSRVGWAYITKEEVIKSGCRIPGKSGKYIKTTDKNWKTVAEKICTDEVKMYDMYLTGEVYYASKYKLDESFFEDNSYLDKNDYEAIEDDENCWEDTGIDVGSFFSDKWGDALVQEIYEDSYYIDKNTILYDSLRELKENA